MRRGAFTIGVPLLWALGGVAFLAMVAASDIVMSYAWAFTANADLHDTYYVVMHWRLVIGYAAAFGVFAGCYYLFPKVIGWSYSTLLGKLHFWLTFVGLGAGVAAMGFVPILMMTYGRSGMIGVTDAFRYVNLVSITGACAPPQAPWCFSSTWLSHCGQAPRTLKHPMRTVLLLARTTRSLAV